MLRIHHARNRIIAAATSLVASTTALAGGGSFGLNIDVQASSVVNGVPTSTYGAAAGQPGFWNVVWANVNTTFALNGLDGQPSGVTIRKTVGNSIASSNCVGGLVDVNWTRLMCDRQSDVAGVVNPIEYELTGLPAGRYDVYTYSCDAGASFAPTHHVGVWTGATYTGTGNVSGAVLTSNFVDGQTHDQRTVVLDPGETMRIRVFDASGEFGDPVFLNGIQLRRNDGLVNAISSPAPQACVEDLVTITGSARGNSFSSYKLEYSADGNDPWLLINASSTSVNNGSLGVWNTAGLTEGYYTIRLTVQDASGHASTSVRTLYLNKVFDTVDLASPSLNGVYGGKVCFDGTVWDQCFDHYTVTYAQGSPGGVFVEVDPMNPVYTSTVINNPLASWDTTGLPDGLYTVNVAGETMAGASNTHQRTILLDNTPPVAVILDPTGCARTCDDVVRITGRVFDENLAGWVLQYSDRFTNTWTTIASGNSNITGTLADWDVSDLPGCCYAIRLIATDESALNCANTYGQTEFVTTIYLGNPLDTNGDGVINSADLASLLAGWGVACP